MRRTKVNLNRNRILENSYWDSGYITKEKAIKFRHRKEHINEDEQKLIDDFKKKQSIKRIEDQELSEEEKVALSATWHKMRVVGWGDARRFCHRKSTKS